MDISFCFRDKFGLFMSKNSLVLATKVWTGEVCGLLKAIEWMRELEMDAKLVVDGFNLKHVDLIEFGVIIDECLKFLSFSCYNSFKSLLGNKANTVAHNYADHSACYQSCYDISSGI